MCRRDRRDPTERMQGATALVGYFGVDERAHPQLVENLAEPGS